MLAFFGFHKIAVSFFMFGIGLIIMALSCKLMSWRREKIAFMCSWIMYFFVMGGVTSLGRVVGCWMFGKLNRVRLALLHY